jgi:hypothetical protein
MDLRRFPWSFTEAVPYLWATVCFGELFLLQVKRPLGLANEGASVLVVGFERLP